MTRILSLSLLLLLLSACGQGEAQPKGPQGTAPAGLEISSPAFGSGASIPSQYTCAGEDLSPALVWSDVPEETKSLALIVDDPDAPMGTWVHWLVYNIPPDARGLPEGASRANGSQFSLPEGAVQGVSSFGRADWGGPCPPSGTHRYFFRLYALDVLMDDPGLDRAALWKAMQGHILAAGEWMGVYQKQ